MEALWLALGYLLGSSDEKSDDSRTVTIEYEPMTLSQKIILVTGMVLSLAGLFLATGNYVQAMNPVINGPQPAPILPEWGVPVGVVSLILGGAMASVFSIPKVKENRKKNKKRKSKKK